jgi:integrase
MEDIVCTLNHWEIYMGDTVIGDIDEDAIDRFKIQSLRHISYKTKQTQSPNTVRKHLRNIRTLLNAAKKRGVLHDTPGIEMPDEVFRNAEDTFTLEEIKALLKATDVFQGEIINGMDAAEWWKNLIIFIYCTAVRITTAVNIRYDWIHNDMLHIHKLDGVKTAYTIPLNKEAIAVTNYMKPYSVDGKVFHWVYCERRLWVKLGVLMDAAEFPQERQFAFHAIRKHTASQVMSKNFAAAVKLLGHTDPKVMMRYYACVDQVCADAVHNITPLSGKSVSSHGVIGWLFDKIRKFLNYGNQKK